MEVLAKIPGHAAAVGLERGMGSLWTYFGSLTCPESLPPSSFAGKDSHRSQTAAIGHSGYQAGQ